MKHWKIVLFILVLAIFFSWFMKDIPSANDFPYDNTEEVLRNDAAKEPGNLFGYTMTINGPDGTKSKVTYTKTGTLIQLLNEQPANKP